MNMNGIDEQSKSLLSLTTVSSTPTPEFVPTTTGITVPSSEIRESSSSHLPSLSISTTATSLTLTSQNTTNQPSIQSSQNTTKQPLSTSSHQLSTNSPSTSSGLARAPSNLELLSLTAAWKEGHNDGNSSSEQESLTAEDEALPQKINHAKICSTNTDSLTTSIKQEDTENDTEGMTFLPVTESTTNIVQVNFREGTPIVKSKGQQKGQITTEEMQIQSDAANPSTMSKDKASHNTPFSSSTSTTMLNTLNNFSSAVNIRSMTPVEHIVPNSSFLPPPLSTCSNYSYINSPNGCQYGFIVGIADTDDVSSPTIKPSQSLFVHESNISAVYPEMQMPKLHSELFLSSYALQDKPRVTSMQDMNDGDDNKTKTQSPATITTTTSINSTIASDSDYVATKSTLPSSSSTHEKPKEPFMQNQNVTSSIDATLNKPFITTIPLVSDGLTSTTSTSQGITDLKVSQHQPIGEIVNNKIVHDISANTTQFSSNIQNAFQPPRSSTTNKRLSPLSNVSIQPNTDNAIANITTYQSFLPTLYTPATESKSGTGTSPMIITIPPLQTTESVGTNVTNKVPSMYTTPTIVNSNPVLSWQQHYTNSIVGLPANPASHHCSYPNLVHLLNTNIVEHRQSLPTGSSSGLVEPQTSTNFSVPFPTPTPTTSSYPSENDFTLVAAAAAGRENVLLRQTFMELQATIKSLQDRVEQLESENSQLRQLPTGKISQIPIEDMIELMQTYGSEVSDTAMPPRKSCVQKASVIRQFRRWNPKFSEFFEYRNGRWVPKLGKEAEIKRRERSRREAANTKKKQSKPT